MKRLKDIDISIKKKWRILIVSSAFLLIAAIVGIITINFMGNRKTDVMNAGKDNLAGEDLEVTQEEKENLLAENEQIEKVDNNANEITPSVAAPINSEEDPQQELVEEETEAYELTEFFKDAAAQKKVSAKTISYGIDVAKWQGIIDWQKVKASGVEFAMIRVGYRTQVTGIINEDPYAKYNIQQAQKNNILIGVYFFSTAINKKEAKEEAAWVAKFIAPYSITYPVVFNCEGFSDKNNRQYGLGKTARTAIAGTFLSYIKAKGYTPMFYASKSELEKNAEWNTDSLSSKYKIWVAQYMSDQYKKTSKSTYTGTHAMWQYTSKGQVPGIEKPVDINVAYFGYKKAAKPKDYTPQVEVIADPAALINFVVVNEKVTAKIEANLRTVPNSKSSDSIVTVLKNGNTVIRTGIGDNGWSRLEYNGQIVYAITSYLTTEITPAITQVPTENETGPNITPAVTVAPTVTVTPTVTVAPSMAVTPSTTVIPTVTVNQQ